MWPNRPSVLTFIEESHVVPTQHTDPRTGDRASGLRVRVQRTNLNGQYMITPNDLFRGQGIYAELGVHERILLGAGLSCEDDWETSLEDIEAWLPGLGRDRHERVRRNLREHGFLSMSRTKIPAGQPSAGKYIWTFAFFMDPLASERRDQLQPTKVRDAGAPMPGFSGHRDGVDETAGQPMPGSQGHRRAGHRRAGPADQGDVYKEEKNQSLEEIPPYPPEGPAADVDGEAATGGGDSSRFDETGPGSGGDRTAGVERRPQQAGKPARFDEQTQLLLAAAVRAVREVRQGRRAGSWTEDAIREAMLTALDADREPGDVAWAIVHAAEDATTLVPNRINNEGWWVQAMSERFVPAPPPLARDKRCPRHPSEPAKGCRAHEIDRRVAAIEEAQAKQDAADDVVVGGGSRASQASQDDPVEAADPVWV